MVVPPASRQSGADASPEVLDPERDAVRLDRRHSASAVAKTPPDARNEWTVGYIAQLSMNV
jgi:hypothetical protein